MANTFIFDDDEQPDMGMTPSPEQDDDQPEEGEGSNRNFLVILTVIGALFLAAVLCVVSVVLFRPGGLMNKSALSATDVFSTQQVSDSQTQAAGVQASATASATVLFLTETPTTTPVVVVFVTDTPSGADQEPTLDPAMATVTELAKTQAALVTVTPLPKATSPKGSGASTSGGAATPTPKIPQTGFADEVGLPALAIVTLILLGIILMARRLRSAPGR